MSHIKLIIRNIYGRGDDSAFGGQLDVLIDIVSYGVAPSILLLNYGKFEPIFLVGAFLMLAASAIRLSYFSTFGLAALNVSQIKTPKLSGNPVNVYILAIYTLGITALYGWKLL